MEDQEREDHKRTMVTNWMTDFGASEDQLKMKNGGPENAEPQQMNDCSLKVCH